MRIRLLTTSWGKPAPTVSGQPLAWPEGWSLPRAGDEVVLFGVGSALVRGVQWYPDGEDGNREPFVAVWLTPHLP